MKMRPCSRTNVGAVLLKQVQTAIPFGAHVSESSDFSQEIQGQFTSRTLEKGRLSQTSWLSHAVYARDQRVLFLPEVSSEWCSSCRDMNPARYKIDMWSLGLII